MNILIVEDDANIRQLLSYYLKTQLNLPFISFAVDVPTAIKRLAYNHYNAVILDYFLGDRDAQPIANHINSLIRKPAVILFTASPKHSIIAKNIKATETITKPFDLENFEKIVRKYVDVTV